MGVFDGLASVFTGALGQAVTVTPAGGSARDIQAIFVHRSNDDLGITQQVPAIHAQSSDVADLTDGDVVSVGGENFIARTFRPDGRGVVTIILETANG